MEQQVPRSRIDRARRWALRKLISRPRLLKPALRLGQSLRALLPAALRRSIPARQSRRPLPPHMQRRRMLVLEGCAQSAATPATNDAARRVLDRLGISLLTAPTAGCCGAVNHHLAAHADGLDDMRRNIDAWWPLLEDGAEAIVCCASGCTSMLADYGDLLAHDPDYARKAERVSAVARDIAQVLLHENLAPLAQAHTSQRVAVHIPCTLQHALQLPGVVPDILQRVGFELTRTCDAHLCCGSAGTYSLLQPSMSGRLRERKLAALCGDSPTVIATANVGCQLHLQAATDTPVKHWIELLDFQP